MNDQDKHETNLNDAQGPPSGDALCAGDAEQARAGDPERAKTGGAKSEKEGDAPPGSTSGSVTTWIGQLQKGQMHAAERLWNHYFERLAGYARQRLKNMSLPVDEGEDVALSAFYTFCEALAAGRLPKVKNRHELWRTLAMIAAGKAIDLRRRENAARRADPTVRQGPMNRECVDALTLESVVGHELDPALAAEIAEEFDRLVARLPGERMRAIALYKLDGLTREEIAEKCGCSPRTITRALAVIRTIWEKTLLAPPE